MIDWFELSCWPRVFRGGERPSLYPRDDVDAPLIVLADSEQLFRLVIADALNEMGYRVIEAIDTFEAYSLIGRCSDVRLLIADIRMSAFRDGLDLARRVQAHHPATKIILLSDLDDRMPPDSHLSCRVVRKSFGVTRLLECVAQLVPAQPPMAAS